MKDYFYASRIVKPKLEALALAEASLNEAAEKLKESMDVYTRIGFPGAYCETDGVHLDWNACPSSARPRFSGKEGYPTLAFNVSALHSREIIHVYGWVAGAVNDQTQVRASEAAGISYQPRLVS